MEINRSAQEAFFKKLEVDERYQFDHVTYHDHHMYKGGMAAFSDELNLLHANFIKELNDNLLNRSASLEVYLNDILLTLERIYNKVKEHFDDAIKTRDSPHIKNDSKRFEFIQRVLAFLDNQLRLLEPTIMEVKQKLRVVSNEEIFEPNNHITIMKSENNVVLKNKIKSKLKKVELTTLLWILAEAECFEFDKNHDTFVKFVENNFQYYDKSNDIYCDMNHMSEEMARLNNVENERKPENVKKKLLERLEKITLPTLSNSILIKYKE